MLGCSRKEGGEEGRCGEGVGIQFYNGLLPISKTTVFVVLLSLGLLDLCLHCRFGSAGESTEL